MQKMFYNIVNDCNGNYVSNTEFDSEIPDELRDNCHDNNCRKNLCLAAQCSIIFGCGLLSWSLYAPSAMHTATTAVAGTTSAVFCNITANHIKNRVPNICRSQGVIIQQPQSEGQELSSLSQQGEAVTQQLQSPSLNISNAQISPPHRQMMGATWVQ